MGKGNLRATFYEGWRAAPRYPRAAGVMGLAAISAAAGTLGMGGWPEWKGYAVELAVTVVVTIGLTAITVNSGDKGKKERPLGSLAALVFVVGVAFGAAGIAQAINHGGWGWIAAGIVFFIFLAGTGVWYGKEVMYPGVTKNNLNRRQQLSQANHGTASRADVWEIASASRMRLDIGQVRPSMAGLSWWQKRRMDIHEFGVELLKLGTGWMPWHRIYASFEQFTVMFGGPRIGKTMLLARVALRAPGFLLTTSTRSDLAEWVQELRSKEHGWKPVSRWNRVKAFILRKSPLVFAEGFGREVHVWNPTKDESIPNTVCGSVPAGCRDFSVAERRAAVFIPDVPGDNSEARRWDSYARPLFAIYLHAADLTGRDMMKVLDWNGDLPPETSDQCRARTEIEQAIDRNPDPVQRQTLKKQIAAHYGLPARTRGSVTFTVNQALQWLGSAKAREMGNARPGDERLFDPYQAVRNNETVHVIGADNQPELVALNRWFISEIEYAIEEIAKSMPNQRLDPPGVGAFDEAGLVGKLPLHQWSAHLGGFGFCMVASFQSMSQMEATLGEASAKTTMGNANNAVVFGGGNSAEDLSRITSLLGQARYKNAGEEHSAADSHHWAKALDEAGVRSLRKGEALVLRQELPPVLGKAPQIWQEKGAKRTAVRPALDTAVEELAASEDTIPNKVTLPVQKDAEEVQS